MWFFPKICKQGDVELKYGCNRLIKLVIVSALLVGFGWPLAFAQDAPKIPYEATARTLDGRTVSLEDHKGKLVFLIVWRTDCKACLLEIPLLNRLQQEYSAEDVTIIGLSMDRGKDDLVERVIEAREINYPVWLGYSQPISKYTYTQIFPTVFAIGPEGEVLWYMYGAFPSYEQAVAAMDQARRLIKNQTGAE